MYRDDCCIQNVITDQSAVHSKGLKQVQIIFSLIR